MLSGVFRPKAIWVCGDLSPLLDETTRRRVQKSLSVRPHQQFWDARPLPPGARLSQPQRVEMGLSDGPFPAPGGQWSPPF